MLESVFYAYRATGDTRWQDLAWTAFQALRKHCESDSGAWASISDVRKTNTEQIDNSESFVYAETLKYLFLTFADPELVSLVSPPEEGERDEADASRQRTRTFSTPKAIRSRSMIRTPTSPHCPSARCPRPPAQPRAALAPQRTCRRRCSAACPRAFSSCRASRRACRKCWAATSLPLRRLRPGLPACIAVVALPLSSSLTSHHVLRQMLPHLILPLAPPVLLASLASPASRPVVPS